MILIDYIYQLDHEKIFFAFFAFAKSRRIMLVPEIEGDDTRESSRIVVPYVADRFWFCICSRFSFDAAKMI